MPLNFDRDASYSREIGRCAGNDRSSIVDRRQAKGRENHVVPERWKYATGVIIFASK